LRIRYQSFIDPHENAEYTEALQSYLDSVADPDVSFEVVGMSPPDKHLHRITEFRCSAHVIRGAIRAKEAGLDAYAIGHFQDGGLAEARSAVDIPVTGLGEASMLFACTLGRKIGLITINPVFESWHEEQVLQYGLQQRVTAVRAMRTSVDLYMRACTEEDALEELAERFRAEALPLVEAGCEVIVPAGGLPATLLARRKEPLDLGGAVFANCVGILAKHTEMAVRCHRLGIARTARNATYALPSQPVLDEFLSSMAH
jgi:Asp/Glu/hydantoin racemase